MSLTNYACTVISVDSGKDEDARFDDCRTTYLVETRNFYSVQ